MLNFTPFARPYFSAMLARRRQWADPAGTEQVQRRVLRNLLKTAAHTWVGKHYNFGQISHYEDYCTAVPAVEYEDIRPMVERMLLGEKDVLWPGACRRFAQSSGTSGGKSKYIPVTPEGLRDNHYRGGAEAVASYLGLNPQSRIFAGKGFILGGSFANELGSSISPGIRVGDLSANLIEAIPPMANFFRVPNKKTALLEDWKEKLPALAHAAIRENISNISGVPSWFLQVLRNVLELSGKSTIHQVWPGLEVFFHGGIAFGPYREQYASITDPARMHYVENYNASEGFFAVQETADNAQGMRLLLDAGVFYEFAPFAGGIATGAPLPAWKVEKGRTYALLISSCNGLWRYSPGDTVRVESTEPLRISIAGRTNSYINAFGEELMVWNADAALAAACRRTGARVANYTAAPVYADCRTKGRHQWFIEWTHRPDCGDEAFADVLDAELQAVNSDYQAKRVGNIFLGRLELTSVPRGTFDRWLASTGRLGGQRKVPRLCSDRRIAQAIEKFLKS